MVRRKAIEGPKSEQNGVMAVVQEDQQDAGRDRGYYAIRPWMETPVVARHGPDVDFIDDVTGSIVYQRDSGARQRVGRFRVFQVRMSDAWEAGWSGYDVLGSHSPELARYIPVLFDPKSGDFHDSVTDEFEILTGKLLVFHSMEILPAHRGNGLGLAVTSKLIDLLAGTPHVLALCCPLPLQFCPHHRGGRLDDPAFRDAMQLQRFTKSVPRAIARLRHFFGTMGFTRIAKTDVLALSTSLVHPKLEDYCKPGLL